MEPLDATSDVNVWENVVFDDCGKPSRFYFTEGLCGAPHTLSTAKKQRKTEQNKTNNSNDKPWLGKQFSRKGQDSRKTGRRLKRTQKDQLCEP